jgi:hypothetical protein
VPRLAKIINDVDINVVGGFVFITGSFEIGGEGIMNCE